MKKLTLFGITLTLLLGLALWQQQLFVANAAPVFNTLTVTNTLDSGPGSLREAVSMASSGETIDFAVTGTLSLSSGRPTMTTMLTSGCATPSFGVPTTFNTGDHPQSVAVGDFNLDGKPDLATANTDYSNINSVSVLLGDGAGGFGAASDFPVGTRPLSVAVGDFNKDGKPDLATANLISHNVSVLLGDGAGGFGVKTDFGAGPYPHSVAVGDFNKDGKPDLATSNYENVSVLLGDGAGGFGAATNFTVGTNPQSVAVGDFNLDGKPDLATANAFVNNSVSVLLGNGAGGFGAASDFPVGDNPRSVAVGDFNLDGKPDFATANNNGNSVSVRLGDGAGGFGAVTNINVSGAYSVAVGDFNLDGKPDLATANTDFSNINSVSVLLNTCNKTPRISAVDVTRTIGAGVSHSQIATVDDFEDALNTLSVKVNGLASATVNNVTVSNITVDAMGVVEADVAAALGASNASFTLQVTDSGGLFSEATLNVTVLYNFSGFFQPVDNLPAVNTVSAGSGIPVKFSLSGNKGMAIFATGSPSSQSMTCGGGTSNDIEETVTAGSSSLSYDATTDTYIYVWKTGKAWKNTCRKLILTFTDGTTKEALFQFR